jgi:transposase
MDRDSLEGLLAQGLSLAEIGRRFGRHESTVAYWLRRHELQAVGRARHAPKGALARPELVRLVERGMSVGEIAETLGRGKTSVRHWLREYGLKTVWAERREASGEERHEMTLTCTRHGMTTFRLRAMGGYRCAKCGTEAVSRHRRKVKQTLVRDAGGACRLCGYDRCIAALEFHHVVPADKRFAMSYRGVTRSLARARQEARKCILLCSNCHAEVEAGVAELAGADCAPLQSVEFPADRPGSPFRGSSMAE